MERHRLPDRPRTRAQGGPPGRPQTTRDYVVGTLRAEILSGRHPGGARLRQEEVASRLGVSTTPVREAFRDLVAEGLIGLDAHRGAEVRGLTLADLRELYGMRIALEPMLARNALAAATASHLDEAEAIHRRLCAEQDPERWSTLNVSFHKALAAPAPDGRLAQTVASLADAAGVYVALSMRVTPELMALNNADHAALLDAYRRGDAAGVEARTAAHLEQTLHAVEAEVARRSTPLARSA